MRVEYSGRSVADLGVHIAGQPSIDCAFSHGVRFTTPNGFRSESTYESVDVDRDDDADVLVLEPGEWDDSDEIIAVVVNERCLRRDFLVPWLKHTVESDPDGPSAAQIFVPEKSSTRTDAAQRLQHSINEKSICADVTSYFAPLVP